MKNIKNIETFLIAEIKSKNKNTYLYKIHNDKIFDKEKFDLLLNYSCQLFEYYENKGRTDNSLEITKGIITLFEHTLFLFYCNQVPSDLYKIINYENVLSEEIIVDYYLTMREITNKIGVA